MMMSNEDLEAIRKFRERKEQKPGSWITVVIVIFLIVVAVIIISGCNTFSAQPAGYVDKHPNLLRDRHYAPPLWSTRYDSHHCQRKDHRQCDH